MPEDGAPDAARALSAALAPGDDSDAPVQLHDGGSTDADGDLHAENVSISQGGARDVYATQVSLNQGGAGRVNAESMSVSMGGVAIARVKTLTIQEGGSAFAVSADSATVEEGANVFLVIARSASGDARILDWRAALAFGAGVGLGLRLLRRR